MRNFTISTRAMVRDVDLDATRLFSVGHLIAMSPRVSPEPIRLWSRYSSLRLVTDRTEARYARRAAVAHAAGRKNNQAAADQTEPYSTNIPF